jgi:hypothetical protein
VKLTKVIISNIEKKNCVRFYSVSRRLHTSIIIRQFIVFKEKPKVSLRSMGLMSIEFLELRYTILAAEKYI